MIARIALDFLIGACGGLFSYAISEDLHVRALQRTTRILRGLVREKQERIDDLEARK